MASKVASTTQRRAPIRVLVRGVSPTKAGEKLGGHTLVVLGAARAEDWPGLWRAGDVEGLVWVGTGKVNEALTELRELPNVVDVRLSMRDVAT